LDDIALERNLDVALYATQTAMLTLDKVRIVGVSTAPNSTSGAADGIVISDGDPDQNWGDWPFQARLTDLSIEDTDRAGVLISGNGVHAVLETVTVTNAGFDPGATGAVLFQDDALVEGENTYALDESEFLPYSTDCP